MTLKELREKQAKLLADARAKMDEITGNTDESRAAELESQHDAIMAEWDGLQSRIERQQRMDEAESRMANAGDTRRPNGENRSTDDDTDDDNDQEPTSGEMMRRALRHGLHNLSEAEQRVVDRVGMRANVPAEVRAQSVGTDSAGGYTVPEDLMASVISSMAIWGPMLDGGMTTELITASGSLINLPTNDDTANEGRIKAENAAADDDGTDDLVFGEKSLNAFWYNTGIVRVSWELLDDSEIDMEAFISDRFGERLGRKANRDLTVGTGSNQPNGIVTASTLGKTAAGTAVIASDELIDLQHSVDAAYRASPKSMWQFNDLTLAVIRKLKDGDGNYLWQMGDIRAGEPATLLGHQYRVNQAMPNVATGLKPIIFGDHSKYFVRKVRGFNVLTLRERYAENFQVGLVGHQRFDGELGDTAAVKHMIMA